VSSIIGKDKDLGMLINDPFDKKQYAIFGAKKKNGQLDSIRIIVETDTETGEWLSFQEHWISGWNVKTF